MPERPEIPTSGVWRWQRPAHSTQQPRHCSSVTTTPAVLTPIGMPCPQGHRAYSCHHITIKVMMWSYLSNHLRLVHSSKEPTQSSCDDKDDKDLHQEYRQAARFRVGRVFNHRLGHRHTMRPFYCSTPVFPGALLWACACLPWPQRSVIRPIKRCPGPTRHALFVPFGARLGGFIT